MEITVKDEELKAILEEILLKIMIEKRELFKEILGGGKNFVERYN